MARIPTSNLQTVSGQGRQHRPKGVDRGGIEGIAKLGEGALQLVQAMDEKNSLAEATEARNDYSVKVSSIEENQRQAISDGDIESFNKLSEERNTLDNNMFASADQMGAEMRAWGNKQKTRSGIFNATGKIRAAAKNTDKNLVNSLNQSTVLLSQKASSGLVKPSDVDEYFNSLNKSGIDDHRKFRFSTQAVTSLQKGLTSDITKNGKSANTDAIQAEINKHSNKFQKKSLEDGVRLADDNYSRSVSLKVQKAPTKSAKLSATPNGEALFQDQMLSLGNSKPNKFTTQKDINDSITKSYGAFYGSEIFSDSVSTTNLFQNKEDVDLIVDKYMSGKNIEKGADLDRIKSSMRSKLLSAKSAANKAEFLSNSDFELSSLEKSGTPQFLSGMLSKSQDAGIPNRDISFVTKDYLTKVKGSWDDRTEGVLDGRQLVQEAAAYIKFDPEGGNYAASQMVLSETKNIPKYAFAAVESNDINFAASVMSAGVNFKANLTNAGKKEKDVIADAANEVGFSLPPIGHPNRGLIESINRSVAVLGVADGEDKISAAADEVKSKYIFINGANNTNYIIPSNTKTTADMDNVKLAMKDPIKALNKLSEVGRQIDIPMFIENMPGIDIQAGDINSRKAKMAVDSFNSGNYSEALEHFSELVPGGISVANTADGTTNAAFYIGGSPLKVGSSSMFSLEDFDQIGSDITRTRRGDLFASGEQLDEIKERANALARRSLGEGNVR